MIGKLFNIYAVNQLKQQIRFIGKRKVNIKKPEREAQLPIFQYPVSKKSNRRVYVWGYLDTGALGLGIKETSKRNEVVKSASRLSFAEKYDITHIACGVGFSVYAVQSSDGNKIFGTGINTDSQIGYHEQKNNKPQNIIFYPAPIILPMQNEKDAKILKLSAGRAHLLILTTEGLFTLGNNSYGQCGRSIVENEKYSGSLYIHNIKNMNGSQITDVQCGQDHSLLITERGEVFGCGWGADGQTGLQHYNIEPQFASLAGDIQGEKITKLSCTADCVLALNDKGEIFGWGNSEYGQLLSNNDEQQIHTPTRLQNCKNLGKIVDIASGGSICMALNEEGSVFVWGYGILGKGREVQQSHIPLQIPPILFGRNDFQPNSKVVSICCGMGHMGAITNFGDLYMWGKNKNGCLGLGHKTDQYFPLKVAVGATVEELFCGLDHSVALCKPFI